MYALPRLWLECQIEVVPAVGVGTALESWRRTGFGTHGNSTGWERPESVAVVHTVLPTQAADTHQLGIPEETAAAETVAPGLCRYHSSTEAFGAAVAGTVVLGCMSSRLENSM